MLVRSDDAHEVSSALLRLADQADEHGRQQWLNPDQRARLATDLRTLADDLAQVRSQPPEILVACPRCGQHVPLTSAEVACGKCGARLSLMLSSRS